MKKYVVFFVTSPTLTLGWAGCTSYCSLKCFTINVTDVDESLGLGGKPWAQTDKAGAKVILATNQNSRRFFSRSSQPLELCSGFQPLEQIYDETHLIVSICLSLTREDLLVSRILDKHLPVHPFPSLSSLFHTHAFHYPGHLICRSQWETSF